MRVPDPRHKDWLVTDELDESGEVADFPDREPGAFAYGTTADEARHHEPLASALAAEEPEPVDDLPDEDIDGWADDDEDTVAGRLVDHAEDRRHFVHELDDDGDYSAEEEAVHLVDE